MNSSMTNLKILHRPDKNFAMIPQTVIKDDRIDLLTKGLLLHLFSQADDWKFYRKNVMEKCGKSAFIYDNMRLEAELAGYLKIYQNRDKESGRLGSYTWEITYEDVEPKSLETVLNTIHERRNVAFFKRFVMSYGVSSPDFEIFNKNRDVNYILSKYKDSQQVDSSAVKPDKFNYAENEMDQNPTESELGSVEHIIRDNSNNNNTNNIKNKKNTKKIKKEEGLQEEVDSFFSLDDFKKYVPTTCRSSKKQVEKCVKRACKEDSVSVDYIFERCLNYYKSKSVVQQVAENKQKGNPSGKYIKHLSTLINQREYENYAPKEKVSSEGVKKNIIQDSKFDLLLQVFIKSGSWSNILLGPEPKSGLTKSSKLSEQQYQKYLQVVGERV